MYLYRISPLKTYQITIRQGFSFKSRKMDLYPLTMGAWQPQSTRLHFKVKLARYGRLQHLMCENSPSALCNRHALYERGHGLMDEPRDFTKAALRGEPSYIWRDGQRRRLEMILDNAGPSLRGCALVDGCGVGMYLHNMREYFDDVIGLDIEFPRLQQAKKLEDKVLAGAGERLPFPENTFDLVLSHEVIEHVQDDRAAIREIFRILRPGGRLVLFCPNRGYPFETHGVYWRGKYHFGNIPLINYLPRAWRDKLAPHVNVYTRLDLSQLFDGLPVKFIQLKTIFGAYDNIITRNPRMGKLMRAVLQWLEKTPFSRLGLSHFWVVEKKYSNPD